MTLCQRLSTSEEKLWKMPAVKFLKYVEVLMEEQEQEEEPEEPRPLSTVDELMKVQERFH